MGKTYFVYKYFIIWTLLSDILTILRIVWACKVFLNCFYNYIEQKQPSSRIEKQIYVKTIFNIPLKGGRFCTAD
jgi:hypothetical protein